MIKLFSYQDFLLESVIKKTMPLYYSEEFRNILVKMSYKSGYADFLLNAEDSNQVDDIYTLIDITDKNDTISFIQVNRIIRGLPDSPDSYQKIEKEEDKEVYHLKRNVTNKSESEFWSKGRTEIGFGRWVRRVMTELHKSSIPDSELEKFVNLYKSSYDLIKKPESRLQIVQGEDLRKWYLESNYERPRGQLGNSCMRYQRCQEYLDIYVKNPEVCQLLILKSEDDKDKITGRALIWKLTNGSYYMDRIYTINDSDKLLFHDFFEKWVKKNLYSVSDQNLEVKLGDYTYSKYPYMDTFIAYNPTTKILSEDEDLWPDDGYWILQNTDGGYKSDDVVWSDWHNEHISSESAVFCNNVDGYVSRDDARYLEYKDEWAAPNDDVVYSEYFDGWYYQDDTVWSEMMNDVLYSKSKDVIEVMINKDEYDSCVKIRTDLYIELDGKYYLRSNVIKDPYTGQLMFSSREFVQELDKKLMDDFGIERNDETISSSGVPKRSVVNEVKEDLKVRLIRLKITDDIKEMIENNTDYKNKVRGVYWGLNKESLPNEEDMFLLLKCFLLSPVKSSRLLSSNIQDYYGKFQFFGGDEKRFKQLQNCGALRQMIRSLETFDLSRLPEDIYKRFLFTTI